MLKFIITAFLCLASASVFSQDKSVKFEKWEFVGLIEETPGIRLFLVKTNDDIGIRVAQKSSRNDQVNNITLKELPVFSKMLEAFVQSYKSMRSEMDKSSAKPNRRHAEKKETFGKVEARFRMTEKEYICHFGEDVIEYGSAQIILKHLPLVKSYAARANAMINEK